MNNLNQIEKGTVVIFTVKVATERLTLAGAIAVLS